MSTPNPVPSIEAQLQTLQAQLQQDAQIQEQAKTSQAQTLQLKKDMQELVKKAVKIANSADDLVLDGLSAKLANGTARIVIQTTIAPKTAESFAIARQLPPSDLQDFTGAVEIEIPAELNSPSEYSNLAQAAAQLLEHVKLARSKAIQKSQSGGLEIPSKSLVKKITPPSA